MLGGPPAWRRWGLKVALAALLTACPRAVPGAAADGVQVVQLQAVFTSDTAGEVRLALEVPGSGREERAVRLTWELRLTGRPFAVGAQVLDVPLGPDGGRVEVVLPLAFTSRPVREEEAPLAVEVRGGLEVTAGRAVGRLPFQAMRVVRVAGAPQPQAESALGVP